jgi:autotransporter translocation and assembly factor TamB
MRWFFALGRFLLLLVLLAIALLYSEVGQGFLRGTIAGRLSLLTGKVVTIGKIDLNFPNSITAYDLHIDMGSEAPFEISQITLEGSLVKLLTSDIKSLAFAAEVLAFKGIILEKATIEVHRDPIEQCWRYSGILTKDESTKVTIVGSFFNEGERLHVIADSFHVETPEHTAFLQSPMNIYFDGPVVNLKPSEFVLADSSLTIEGCCSDDIIDAQVYLQVPSLETIEGLMPNVNLTGKASLKLDIEGAIQSPKMNGEIILEEATLESLASGALFHNIHARGVIDNQQLNLITFNANDLHDGSFSATGVIKLDWERDFPFALNFELEKAAIVDLGDISCKLTGKGSFEGNKQKAKVSGEFNIDDLQLTLKDDNKSSNPQIDVVYVNQEPGESPTTFHSVSKSNWPLALDLQLHSRGTIYISNEQLTSQWKGDVTIQGTSNEPKFLGDVRLESGEYVFSTFLLSRKFKLTTGTIAFHGDIKKKTDLYIVGMQEIAGVDAEVVVKGPLSDLDISFRSNPPLPEKEILSLFIFGRSAGEITPIQGEELTESINKLKSGGSTNGNEKGFTDPFSIIKNAMGIDRIDFNGGDFDNAEQTSVQVGKYVVPGVFVGVKREFTTETNSIGIEADLNRNVKFQAEVGDDAEGQFLLKWKRDY